MLCPLVTYARQHFIAYQNELCDIFISCILFTLIFISRQHFTSIKHKTGAVESRKFRKNFFHRRRPNDASHSPTKHTVALQKSVARAEQESGATRAVPCCSTFAVLLIRKINTIIIFCSNGIESSSAASHTVRVSNILLLILLI